MRRSLFTVICLLVMAQCLFAQNPNRGVVEPVLQDSISTAMHADDQQSQEPDILGDTTLYINRITISKDSFNEWKSEKGFGYMPYLDSMLRAKKAGSVKGPKERIAPRDISWMENVLKSKVLHAFLWMIAGAFVLFIIYRLFLNKGIFVRYARRDAAIDLQPEKEEIQDTDFRQLIRHSVSQGDYRKAIRYQYLNVLQQLSAGGHVMLASEKTNAAYVKEVPAAIRQPFAALTLIYEYVWFGHQEITGSRYSELEQAFSRFNNGEA